MGIDILNYFFPIYIKGFFKCLECVSICMHSLMNKKDVLIAPIISKSPFFVDIAYHI